MKKLLLIAGLLWSAVASAQFVPGQILTAAELNSQFALYAPLAGSTFTGPVTAPLTTGSSGVLQGFLDNSTHLATTSFTKQTVLAATAEIPIASFTGGTYNFASIGTGAQLVVFASGGTVSSILTIANPGTGYQVGDCLVMVGGNGDAIVRVTSVSGGGITAASPIYGGTGYTTGAQLTGSPLPPGSRTANLNGVLASNATIIIPAGTFLQGARRIGFQNNTTGAFTTTVKLSNGAGGSTGTGVVLAQGTANSTSILLYTDGVTDVWPETATSVPGTIPLTALAVQAANTIVANATAGSASPTALAAPSCSTSSSALQWTSGTGLACNSAINASTLGSVAAASYLTSSVAASTYATIAQATTALAATGGSINGVTVGATTPSTVAATTLSSTGNFTPSQTNGIIGTTTNNNANAGSVGEIITNAATGVSLSSGSASNLVTISLTAGDWDVSGVATLIPAGTTTTLDIQTIGISTTSLTFAAANTGATVTFQGASNAGRTQVAGTPTVRISLASTTTVFLLISPIFAVSTATANGFIRARRVR